MVPFYSTSEKAPELMLLNHDSNLDVETEGEQRSLFHRKNKDRKSPQGVIVLLVYLLLVSAVVTLGTLSLKCSNKDHGHIHGASKTLFNIKSIFMQEFVWKRPHGWNGTGPVSKRETTTDIWEDPKGWQPINDLQERDSEPWKNVKGWVGRIGTLTRRVYGYKYNKPGLIDSAVDVVGSTAKQVAGSLNTAINASITVPLYSYPGDNAQDWEPIFTALNSSSTTKFTIIINPDNGPGSGAPDVNFQTGIKKLKSFSNAEVFGYVHQSYGKRNLTAVQTDLFTYASWRSPEINILIDGIFFDESPSDKAYTPYVAAVNTFAKAQKLTTTIQNAGTIPDKEYFASTQNTDITVIMENSYDDYTSHAASYDGLDTKYGVSKSAFSYIIYEAPTDVQNIRDAVTKMTKQVGHVFMSDLTQDDAYTNISADHFTTFISAMVRAFSS
ncbi:hypothetical protein H072_4488 [Dactylellina haptotyla CBS 200.50]|uniref:Spherulin 4-like cell surface protein n=1 Tax=Dactylellina haptotyla (strain CBS 200.50) TaxID=1284197 RepID=S8BQ61_DACHA|nr:hypothetical protein H072_4488 [Dactylellina haptotyla CBS 200.50]